MQVSVTLVFAVEDGRDVLGLPFVGALGFLALEWLPNANTSGGDSPQKAVGSESVYHVTQHRVVDAVADEAHGVVAKQLADETRRPALGKISETEVATRHDQAIQVASRGFGGQQTVKITSPSQRFLGTGSSGA